MRNTQAHGHLIRKGDRRKEGAARFDNQADDRAAVDIQRPLLHQELADRRIEERVVDDVLHMAIRVVVTPARAEGVETPKIFATGTVGLLAHTASARLAAQRVVSDFVASIGKTSNEYFDNVRSCTAEPG
ncbi:hypothetical protein D3C77_319190 [compost metagenome]